MTQPTHSEAAASGAQGLQPAPATSRKLFVIAVVVTLALAALVWYASARPGKTASNAPAGPPPAVRVVAAPVQRGDLDAQLFALGTVTPTSVVVVRTRVDGQLVQVAFQEGQIVNKGDVVAQIDPRPFEVQLQLANGQRARNQALLESARTDLERFRTLLKQDSISALQVDTQASLVRQYEAVLQADQGTVDNAKLQLAYASIVAPISGRVGLRQVDAGNMVRASDPNGIVVITQLQPINVVFSIPEDHLPRVLKRLRAGERIAVHVYDRAITQRLASGWLLTADNQIDPSTGTVKLKAEFTNKDGMLTANQFVNVKMAVETLDNALLVPTSALQRGTNGSFVYVIDGQGTVKAKSVQVRTTDGEVSAVEGPLSAGERVVVDGADRLRDGALVEVAKVVAPAAPTRGPAASGPASAAARKGSRA
jgi:multidrug efflux system membrane fusion protein